MTDKIKEARLMTTRDKERVVRLALSELNKSLIAILSGIEAGYFSLNSHYTDLSRCEKDLWKELRGLENRKEDL